MEINEMLLKKIGYIGIILGILILSFTTGYMVSYKKKSDCKRQDDLVHQMQNRIQNDSNLIVILKRSSNECSKQSYEIINEYEKRIKVLNNSINLLKTSNLSLKDGLAELQKRKEKIDSIKLNKNQLYEYFKNY